MLSSLLFQCVACRETSPTAQTLPLCPDCVDSLVAAPALCSVCASPLCLALGASCQRPWIENPDIASFSARYLLIDPGYRVLKRWKLTRGPALNRLILKSAPDLLQRWREARIDSVVHIPQRVRRTWLLGGSPADEIARWVSRCLGVPRFSALKPAQTTTRPVRQAELGMQARLQNRIRFEWDESAGLRPGSRVLLVDDFMTSGHTLRAGARELRSRGALVVHAFCLGVRPLRGGSTEVAGHGSLGAL